MSKNSCLSDKGILRCINETKSIFIHPFSLKQLSTSSYDVTLGENYYREQEPDPLKMLYNPYSEKDVSRVWGKPCVAEFAKDLFKESEIPENISPDDQIILIRPNETILAHTVEFIGGRYNVTTMMKARSSMGRNFIEVCKCAGWGDVGYINRWTMEITNNSRYYTLPLVVGRRIAQIIFFETEGIVEKDYSALGKYQTTENTDLLVDSWNPTAMLPKMFNDWEISIKK